jgi:hypothetical protein
MGSVSSWGLMRVVGDLMYFLHEQEAIRVVELPADTLVLDACSLDCWTDHIIEQHIG